MSASARRRIYLFSIPLVMMPSSLAAQQATSNDVIELPPVVVTTPSPVVKPVARKAKPKTTSTQASVGSAKKKAASAPKPKPPAAAANASAVDAEPELAEMPALPLAPVPAGTLIVVDDTFAPVTVATDRDIVARQGATITDTLMSKPGISGSTFAPGANRPIVRGLDSYRVRMQENGIGSHDVSTISEDHAVPIDPFSADRIEVVRGPATLRYGSGAIGGVVAVENQRIPTFMPARGFSGEIKGGVSSVDDGRDGAFRATAGSNGIVVHADAFKRSSDDYRTPRGTQRNSFVDSEGFGAGMSRVWSEGFMGVAISRVDSVYGVPGEEADEGVDPRIDLAQQKIQARGEWRPKVFGVEAVRFWFGASDYAHNELARHDGDDFELGSRFTNREQEGRVELQHIPTSTALGELTGAIGIQLGHRQTRGQSFEGESLLEPARTNSIAAFWFEELKASDRVTFQAAMRIERTAVDGLGWTDVSDPDAPLVFDGERRFVPVSVSLGMLYKLGLDTTARLSGQFVERSPDAAELFSKGIHEATGTFEVGNPNLEKEQALSIEAGLARSKGSFRFDATAFYTRYQGFIYRAIQDVRCLEDLPSCGPAADLEDENFDLVFFRQRDAIFYGLELAAQYDVAPIWRGTWGVDGRYDFVNARFEGGENVPRIPPHRLGGAIYYRDANWFARLGLLHAFDQNRVGVNEIETPDFTLVSAELSYTSEIGNGARFTLGLKGENLADDVVLNHASFKRREEVLLPGASVRLFGSIKFN
ncbi:MAG: TonB-dependent receptor [Hyphomicrobiaceae bacterium]|nr:TonB-dependent receptor [Hyphomicrobiaceae bacterium]